MGNKVSTMLRDEEIEIISEETGFSPAQIERLYSRFTSLDKSGICGSLSRQDFLRVPELAINPLCDRIVHMFFVDCDEDHDRINFRQFMKVLATFRSSTRPTKSRNPSRQESYQNVLSSLTQNSFIHSRHSSCEGFFNYYPAKHHTTNQHSIHYVASTTHLSSMQHSHSHNNNNNHHHHHGHHHGHGHHGHGHHHHSHHNVPGQPKPLLDDNEPANSRKQKLFFMFKVYDIDNDNLLSLDDLKGILKLMVGNYISQDKLADLAEKALRQADKNCDGFIDFEEFCTEFSDRDIDEELRVKFVIDM